MISIRKILLAAAIVLCFTQVASAEVRAGAVTLSPMVGGYLYEGDQGIEENSLLLGGGIGYMLTDHLGIEGVLGFISGRTDGHGRVRYGKGDVDGRIFMAPNSWTA